VKGRYSAGLTEKAGDFGDRHLFYSIEQLSLRCKKKIKTNNISSSADEILNLNRIF
jgi:hypothetical protein